MPSTATKWSRDKAYWVLKDGHYDVGIEPACSSAAVELWKLFDKHLMAFKQDGAIIPWTIPWKNHCVFFRIFLQLKNKDIKK